jgi:hypothetical protein
MGEQGRHWRPSLVWPMILIAAGILFLLSNLGVLDIDFWQLWRLWPVLLILAGIDLILGRRSALGNMIVLVLTLVIVVGVVGLVVLAPETLNLGRASQPMQIEEPLGSVERADLKIGFAAGTLEVGRLQDADSLIQGDLKLATNRRPLWDASRSGESAKLVLQYTTGSFQSWGGRGDHWDLALSPQVALALEADIGAGDATIDLTGLDVTSLQVKTGAGRSTIILPAEGRFDAQITGGVGQLVVEIPREMAAQIRINRGLGGSDISRRFGQQDGNLYQSEDWETNDNRVTIQIEVGIGQVSIRDR